MAWFRESYSDLSVRRTSRSARRGWWTQGSHRWPRTAARRVHHDGQEFAYRNHRALSLDGAARVIGTSRWGRRSAPAGCWRDRRAARSPRGKAPAVPGPVGKGRSSLSITFTMVGRVAAAVGRCVFLVDEGVIKVLKVRYHR